MRKLRIGMVVGIVSLAAAASANAAAGGDANAGDVWLDNVGQPAGPGHEMDPHLTCTDINLWGAGLADGSGTFTIDGWPPSGKKEQDYAASWSSTGGKTPQVVAVIDVQTLIAQAAANGDQPAKQGYHFKLEFSQDPQKHKTFWVNCPAPGPGATTPIPPGKKHGKKHGTSGSTSTSGSTTTTSTSGTSGSTTTQTSGSSGTQSVSGVKKHRRRHRHRHLLKPRRHHRSRIRHAANHPSATALFTG
jgi:hypothetical protein